MTADRFFDRQIRFLVEIDALKSVLRQSTIVNRSRRENSAEHSWHLAMFALVFAEDRGDLDLLKVLKMLLIHDIVEIDAGDAPIHGAGATDKLSLAQQEQAAAERIFLLLPPKQADQLLNLWREFEEGLSPEARFAKGLDRLQPLLLNTLTRGGTWTENGVTEEQVHERYGPAIRGASESLWLEAASLVRAYFEQRGRDARSGGH
jgi:putative hydrolase of HD superfamily